MRQETASRLALIRSMPVPMPVADRHRHDISQLAPNGFFTFEGKTYKVVSRALWNSEDGSTATEFEVVCLDNGNTEYFEWWNDLGLFASHSFRRATLRDLHILERDVDEIGVVRLDGEPFEADEGYEVEYKPDNGPAKMAKVRTFVNSQHTLSIQKWKDGIDTWVSEEINPNQVQILALGS